MLWGIGMKSTYLSLVLICCRVSSSQSIPHLRAHIRVITWSHLSLNGSYFVVHNFITKLLVTFHGMDDMSTLPTFCLVNDPGGSDQCNNFLCWIATWSSNTWIYLSQKDCWDHHFAMLDTKSVVTWGTCHDAGVYKRTDPWLQCRVGETSLAFSHSRCDAVCGGSSQFHKSLWEWDDLEKGQDNPCTYTSLSWWLDNSSGWFCSVFCQRRRSLNWNVTRLFPMLMGHRTCKILHNFTLL